MTREAWSIRVKRGLRETNRMDSRLITNRLAAALSIRRAETRSELANRVPPKQRSAPYAMNPTNPAAQNLTVLAITTMLRTMRSQPIAVWDELAASCTSVQPDRKTAAMQKAATSLPAIRKPDLTCSATGRLSRLTHVIVGLKPSGKLIVGLKISITRFDP